MDHHAYIYEGPLALLPALALDAKERFGFSDMSADAHARSFEKFGIDESRWLSQTASLRAASGRGLFVMGAGSMTSESQQALLKLFEEPQRGIVFVLLVPHGVVLPTLRSRMLEYPTKLQVVRQNSLASPGRRSSDRDEETRGLFDGQLAAEFLKSDQKKRSDFIAKLLKDEEGAKERVRDLLLGCEELLLPKIVDAKVRAGLEDIQKVRSYVGDRSASLKMLLEHLAIALPKL